MPLVIEFAGRSMVGSTEDIGVGGLGARCDALPPDKSRLALLFNLPTGSCVRTDAVVRYVLPSRFGVEFTTLPPGAREALDEYTKKTLGYVRRGGRIAKRLHVTLRSTKHQHAPEQVAETVVLNHFGGLLICRAPFQAGDVLQLCWPEKDRKARIRIAHRHPCGPERLVELGFEFVDQQNFWGTSELE